MTTLTYRGWNGQLVPALFILPKNIAKSNPPPCLLIVHGIGGCKEQMTPIARLAAQDGYASLIIDLPNFGARYKTIPRFVDSFEMAQFIQQEFVQSVVDLRRGIDYLQTIPKIDSNRIGIIGVSLGGFIATDLAAVDRRLKMSIMIATGGGLKDIIAYQQKSGVSVEGVSDNSMESGSRSESAEIILSSVDPLNYIAEISPRPLLMENGDRDTIVPPSSAIKLYERAREPKSIDWFVGEGHIPNPLGLYASVNQFLKVALPITKHRQ